MFSVCVILIFMCFCLYRRYFVNEIVLKDHFKTKSHKKRYVHAVMMFTVYMSLSVINEAHAEK